MRLMRTCVGAITCVCLAVSPAFAGQRGPHPTPQPVHPATPAPPATGAVRPPTPARPATGAARPATPAHPAAKAVRPATVPVPETIVANPALATRLQLLLPSGMTMADAAAGFRNQGQFIAALHVSWNLNIPFAQLKTAMTGTDHNSLGQAIHELQPTVNAKAAAKTAEQEAAADLKAAKSAKTDADKDSR